MKQGLEELERLHQDVSATIKSQSTSLATTQCLVAKFEHTLHSAHKMLSGVADNLMMKYVNSDLIQRKLQVIFSPQSGFTQFVCLSSHQNCSFC